MKLILEVNGKVKDQVFVSEQGITIGRSWDNDVILKDRYVDPQQAKLSLLDDSVVIEDLGSTNGTEVEGARVNGEGLKYVFGSVISVGDTIIRLLEVNTDVAKTQRRSIWFHCVRVFKPLPLLFLLLTVVACAGVFKQWAYSTETFAFVDAMSEAFKTLSAIILIAACFSIFNKLFKGKSSFKEHIIVVSFIFFVRQVIDFLVWVIRFNVQESSFGEILATASEGAITTLFIVGGLSYITQLGRFKIWLIGIVFSLAIIYYGQADEFSKQDHERWTEYGNTESFAFPPTYLFKSPTDVESYLNASETLFDKADEAK